MLESIFSKFCIYIYFIVPILVRFFFHTWGRSFCRMRSGFTHYMRSATSSIFMTVNPCCEKFVTAPHNASLRIREDLGPSLLCVSLAELSTHIKRYVSMGTTRVNTLKWELSFRVCTTYRYASEKTSAPVFFTFRWLNSPHISIETPQRGLLV